MSYQHAPLRKKTAQEKMDRFGRLVRRHQKRHGEAPWELRETENRVKSALASLCHSDDFKTVAEYYYPGEQTCADRVLLQMMASKYHEPTMLLEKHDRQLFMLHLDEQYSEEDDGEGDGPQPTRRAYFDTETRAYTTEEPQYSAGGSPQYQGPCYEYEPSPAGEKPADRLYLGPEGPQVSEAWPCPSSPQYRQPRYRLTDEGTVEEESDEAM